jgi:hypothetical protein
MSWHLLLSRQTSETVDLDWENLGFGIVQTDYMYIAKCGTDGNFSEGEMVPFGPIALSPSSGVLNYGQVSRIYRSLCFIYSVVDQIS